MSRGMYNESLDEWLQEFAEINRVTVRKDFEDESIYRIDYGEGEVSLQVRPGSDEELATLTGEQEDYLSEFTELVEKVGYELDWDERSRPVILDK